MAILRLKYDSPALKGQLHWIKSNMDWRDQERNSQEIARIENAIRNKELESEPITQESAEFIEFRTSYYQYQYDFISRAKNISEEVLNLYKKLTTDEGYQRAYGAIENRATLRKRYALELILDFSLSKRQAKEEFKKTSEELWRWIETSYDDYHKTNKNFITEFPTTKDCKKADIKGLFEAWDKALKVYDLYEKQVTKNKAEISRALGWFNVNDRQHCSDEVAQKLKYALRLIDAASKGDLYKEACRPMTEGKKRLNKD